MLLQWQLKLIHKPSWNLLVQSQPQKHYNNVWNLLTISKLTISKSLLLTLTNFTHCSGVSIVDFEQVNEVTKTLWY